MAKTTKSKKSPKLDQKGSPSRGDEHVFNMSERLNRQFGGGQIMPLSHAASTIFKKLPTGLLYVDRLLEGGWAFGRIHAIWGPKSAFKTTTMLRAIRNAQNYCRYCKTPIVRDPDGGADCQCPKPRYRIADPAYMHWLTLEQSKAINAGRLPDDAKKDNKGHYVAGKKPANSKVDSDKKKKKTTSPVYFEQTHRCEPCRIIYVDAEGTLDVKWVKKNGVNPAGVSLLGSSWAERTFDTLDNALAEYEDDGITPVVDIVVVDSMTQNTPRERLEKSHEDEPRMAINASKAKRAVEKWTHRIHEPGLSSQLAPTFFLVYQSSTRMGTGFSYLGAAGMSSAMDHACMTILRFDVKKWSKQNDWAEFLVTAEKNKGGGSAGKNAKVMVRFQVKEVDGKPIGDASDADILVKCAIEHSISVSESKGGYTYQPPVGDELTFKSIKAFSAYLRENPTVYDELRRATLAHLIDNDLALPAQAGVGEKDSSATDDDDDLPGKRPVKRQTVIAGMKGETGVTVEGDFELAPFDIEADEVEVPKRPKKKKAKKSKKADIPDFDPEDTDDEEDTEA